MRIFLLLFLVTSVHSLLAVDFKVDMGAGLYYTGAEGKVEYVQEGFKGSYADADLTSSAQLYLWGVIDLKKRFVPKIRLEYLRIKAEGDSKAHLESGEPAIQKIIDDYINNNGAIDLNDQNWNSFLQHDIYDAILYYDFFENQAFPSIGLGAGYRYFEYVYIMDIHYVPGLQFGDRDNAGSPFVYLNSRYDMSSINMSIEGDVKYYPFGDSKMYDWKVKMDLMFPIDDETSAGLEFGYREQYFSLEGKDVENVTGNMHNQGIFVGVVIKFK